MTENISVKNNILAFDHDWQFPAMTEQHAYHQIRDLGTVPDGVTYIAYPWANLIDKIQTNAQDIHTHMAHFRKFCQQVPDDTVNITVCQHIKMQEYMDIFAECGIAEIFWAHANHTDTQAADAGAAPALRAFPLYPVQVTEETPAAKDPASHERPCLFSFVGTKPNKCHLTRTREWIIDLLPNHPRGTIVGHDCWHHIKIISDHQIRPDSAQKPGAEKPVEQFTPDQFKTSLADSIFSLCPSGSGPNSTRLWESLGAGAIPVILADTYVPPGNSKLWDAAVVFCEETPEAIKALPARLEAIAADPKHLATMRHAMRQLWMLYGPHSFVYDVQKRMLALIRQDTSGRSNPSPGGKVFRDKIVQSFTTKANLSKHDAQLLLRTSSSNLLLAEAGLLEQINDHSPLGQFITLAKETLGDDHATVTHFDRVLNHARGQAPRHPVSRPAVQKGAAPKICLFGQHANRTPLSYTPFQQVADNRIAIVETPEDADVIMTGFNFDLRENTQMFEIFAKTRPATRVMVISEEPLWDSNWSGGFMERNRQEKCGEATLGYTFLNHSNSKIFDFTRIPYFLLTNEDFLTRYGLLIARHATKTPAELLAHWKQAQIRAAFFAEVREGETYDKSFHEQAVYGLSTYRTDVAKLVSGDDVMRVGKGWHSDTPRQDLPDWHLDKLATLGGRVRVASSYENTHQNSYISEKIFDAFVVGGIPTYYAGPDHRVLNLVPEASMINTFGLSANEAAVRISEFQPDEAFAVAWLQTAQSLQQRFTDGTAITTERLRIVDEIMRELEAVL